MAATGLCVDMSNGWFRVGRDLGGLRLWQWCISMARWWIPQKIQDKDPQCQTLDYIKVMLHLNIHNIYENHMDHTQTHLGCRGYTVVKLGWEWGYGGWFLHFMGNEFLLVSSQIILWLFQAKDHIGMQLLGCNCGLGKSTRGDIYKWLH